MNIDDLRKLNGIVVPDTTQQGDTVQGGTSNTPETCCPTSAETEEKKTSDTFVDPPEESYSQTRNNDLGAIIDQDESVFSQELANEHNEEPTLEEPDDREWADNAFETLYRQNEDSVIEELTNEEYGDSHVYTQIEEENTQHKSSEYQTWSTKVGEFGDDNDEKKSDSIVTEDDERDVDMHLDMSMTERIKEYIRNLPDLWEVDFICIMLTAAMVVTIITDLPAVLAFIFGILCSVIGFIFVILFCIIMIIALIYLLNRRRRR